MTGDKNRKKPDKAMRALLNMDAVPHERPKHTKAGLERKFVMRVKQNASDCCNGPSSGTRK